MADNERDVNLGDGADRGIPSITNKGRGKGGAVEKVVIGVFAVLTVVALVAVNGGFSSDEEGEEAKDTTGTSAKYSIGNLLGPAPVPLPPPPPPGPTTTTIEAERPVIRTGEIASAEPPPPPPPAYNLPGGSGQQVMTPEQRKRAPGIFASESSQGGNSSGYELSPEEEAQRLIAEQQRLSGGGVGSGPAERADGLSARLKPAAIEGARASLLVDRDLFITRGTFLNCALQTAISSDVPGMISCLLTRDVYSANGRVLLMERGTKMTGRYAGGLQRGQARIFAIWERAETPNGVLVDIGSPGTDALGRSGHEGYIDTHFGQRFGSAIMLSIIDDLGDWAANKNKTGGDTVQLGNTSDAAQNAAGIALQNSINIPPTLTKNQGDLISVFVARDLDFRGVYELVSK